MLLLRRKLNELTYIGRNLSNDDLEGSFEYRLRVTRIVDSFENPRVTAELTDANGVVETVVFTPRFPAVKVGDAGEVKLTSIRAIQQGVEVEPYVTLGFEFGPEWVIVRDNARRKG